MVMASPSALFAKQKKIYPRRVWGRFRKWKWLAMVTLLSKIDVLMIAHLDNFNAVGLYSVAYKFADLVSYAVLAVLAPVTTLLVAAWPMFHDEFRRRARSAAMTVGLLSCVAVAGMWASADRIVALLYGERFAESADATRMLLVGAVFAITPGLDPRLTPLLVGVVLSAFAYGYLLSEYSEIRLIRVIQGSALLTVWINGYSCWQQEPRRLLLQLQRHRRHLAPKCDHGVRRLAARHADRRPRSQLPRTAARLALRLRAGPRGAR